MADGGISTVLRILVLRGIVVDLALCGYSMLCSRSVVAGLGVVDGYWREKAVGCEFEVWPGRRWEGIRGTEAKYAGRKEEVFLVCSVLFFCSCHSIHPSSYHTSASHRSAPFHRARLDQHYRPLISILPSSSSWYPSSFVFVAIKSTANSGLLTVYVVRLKKISVSLCYLRFFFQIVCITSVLALCSLVQMKSRCYQIIVRLRVVCLSTRRNIADR